MEEKEWIIPVTWECFGTVAVKAETLEKAMKIAKDEAGDIPLPEGNYVDSSWQLSCEDAEYVRQCYNQNQPDSPYWSVSEIEFKIGELASIYPDSHVYFTLRREDETGIEIRLFRILPFGDKQMLIEFEDRYGSDLIPISWLRLGLDRWRDGGKKDPVVIFRWGRKELSISEINVDEGESDTSPKIEIVLSEIKKEGC